MSAGARICFVLITSLSTLGPATFSTQQIRADESIADRQQVQERMQEVGVKIREAIKRGQHEEVRELMQIQQRLTREMSELAQKANAVNQGRPSPERQEIAKRLSELSREAHRLRTNKKHIEAEEIRLEMAELMEKMRHLSRPAASAPLSEEMKIKHLHEAAESLEAAGFHDEAREFHQRAERMQQELNRHRHEDHAHHDHHQEHLHEELVKQVENMRKTIQHTEHQMREMQIQLDAVTQEFKRSQRLHPQMKSPLPMRTPQPLENQKADGAHPKAGRTVDPFRAPENKADPPKFETKNEASSKLKDQKNNKRDKKKQPQGKVVKEVVLSMDSMKFLLDLDTGKTMDPPATVRPEQDVMDIAPLQFQPYEQPTALAGYQLRGFKVQPKEWEADNLTLIKKLEAYPLSQLTKLRFDASNPATYIYRTQDGAEGILQLTELSDQPKGIRVRYRPLN